MISAISKSSLFGQPLAILRTTTPHHLALHRWIHSAERDHYKWIREVSKGVDHKAKTVQALVDYLRRAAQPLGLFDSTRLQITEMLFDELISNLRPTVHNSLKNLLNMG